MNVVNAALALIRKLSAADERLQIAFRNLLQRYFQFLKNHPTGFVRRPRRLRMRVERDRGGLIRTLSWTVRLSHTRKEGERTMWLTKRLLGPFHRDWVYSIAKDWPRLESYEEFERERATLTSLRSQVVDALRRLRLAFANGWAKRGTPEDRAEIDRLMTLHASSLKAKDLRALAGIVAFHRALAGLEMELGQAVDRFRRAFDGSFTVSFEPALRPTEGGTLRLYWGFPQRVATSQGTRTFTDYMSGWPTDRAMRKLHIPAGLRRRVGALVGPLRSLERRYRELVSFLGNHRRRAYELLSRLARHEVRAGRGNPRQGS